MKTAGVIMQMSKILMEIRTKNIIIGLLVSAIVISSPLLYAESVSKTTDTTATARLLIIRVGSWEPGDYITLTPQTMSSYTTITAALNETDKKYDVYLAWCEQMGCDHSSILNAPSTAISTLINENEARSAITTLGFHDLPVRPDQIGLKSSGHILHSQYEGKYYTIAIFGT